MRLPGERLVLKAQMMGLNTCWVALTFSKVKSAYTLNDGEKLAPEEVEQICKVIEDMLQENRKETMTEIALRMLRKD